MLSYNHATGKQLTGNTTNTYDALMGRKGKNMQQRYFLQKMKASGCPYYEIIDTANGCESVYFIFDRVGAAEKLEELQKVEELMETMQADFEARLFPERCY